MKIDAPKSADSSNNESHAFSSGSSDPTIPKQSNVVQKSYLDPTTKFLSKKGKKDNRKKSSSSSKKSISSQNSNYSKESATSSKERDSNAGENEES